MAGVPCLNIPQAALTGSGKNDSSPSADDSHTAVNRMPKTGPSGSPALRRPFLSLLFTDSRHLRKGTFKKRDLYHPYSLFVYYIAYLTSCQRITAKNQKKSKEGNAARSERHCLSLHIIYFIIDRLYLENLISKLTHLVIELDSRKNNADVVRLGVKNNAQILYADNAVVNKT